MVHGVDQSPGAGGWPTVRYFNKETGYGGATYPKKTQMAMCDELGPKEDYMQQFVEEQGGTSLCKVDKLDTGCTDKQKTFIGKWSGKPGDEFGKQLERLSAMVSKDGSSMKAEALSWAKQRMAIFKQLKAKAEL
uniref:Uncharacterized protein n=1 Tax=Alexandrium andersonii TaxID=327968 RepID=A0A7S2DEY7_9DINO|mmetsp:Transcript_52649/g.118932  ORF Transcript_52649/g.118932 Transcript_52649/m.118932 type:complete len:134 (+) Transcript_52649:374-775(+)